MVIDHFSSDLTYVWLLTWLITPSFWKCFFLLGFQELYTSLSALLFHGPLLKVSFAGSSSSSHPLNIGCHSAVLGLFLFLLFYLHWLSLRCHQSYNFRSHLYANYCSSYHPPKLTSWIPDLYVQLPAPT